MLLSESVYKRVPLYWMIGGLLFLFLGLSGGTELRFFFAYPILAALCISRSIWIYQARWKFYKRNEVSLARGDTMVIRHPLNDDQKKTP